MAYIKRLVMQGFKSFPRKTEIPFTPGINVVLGPNGSGKSNVSDALCFVLGRLSVKSMRAAKAKNLIFMGTKSASASKEAIVELVFDNSDRSFTLDSDEISIKRIVRKNGQSIYKINGQTKTRNDILSLLAQAGIDPNGFNIILQGEIQNFVRMHNEERRKIIEEVSGISIYESRKSKSLKELDKTEEKLKEVLAVLRERTAYLNNLEKERQQAIKYKKYQEDVKKLKASIINLELSQKNKERDKILEEVYKKNKQIEKVKKRISELNLSIQNFEEKISSINDTIKKSTGLEQEKLNSEIANLRAELAGINVKLENSENKFNSITKQKSELQEFIRNNEVSIKELQKESPTVAKKQKELDSKKRELEKLEAERKKFYMIKTELKSAKERFEDKRNLLQNYKNESDFLLKQINLISQELYDKSTTKEKIEKLKHELSLKNDSLISLGGNEKELEKLTYSNENEIERETKLRETVSKLDICPLCKSNITDEHLNRIKNETSSNIEKLNKENEDSERKLKEINNKRETLKKEISEIQSEVSRRESDLIKLSNIEDKKEQIKTLQSKIDSINNELVELEKRKKYLEKNFDENSNIEKKYETTSIEVREISIRSEETLDSEISFKQKELERSRISLKQLLREEEDYSEEIKSLKNQLKEKEETLLKRKQQEENLTKKFNKFIEERDSYQKKIREHENLASEQKNINSNIEQEINNLKIEKAQLDAKIENLENEMLDFPNIELMKGNRDNLSQRLEKTQEVLSRIGSVNLRSLEVYDEVKKEYDTIKEKVDVITKEKEGILKIMHEIDIKKKRAFMKTFNDLNEIFSRNFAQISTKGQVSLELENKKDPFDAGVGIVVKTGHGKYFDVKSLSGGEQTMVALSLIFAIQELNPYYFYILDEIDAALDKRNSERLANLLKKYMQKGQYIIITHNDEVITNATTLYGVSMHDGISKIISMKV